MLTKVFVEIRAAITIWVISHNLDSIIDRLGLQTKKNEAKDLLHIEFHVRFLFASGKTTARFFAPRLACTRSPCADPRSYIYSPALSEPTKFRRLGRHKGIVEKVYCVCRVQDGFMAIGISVYLIVDWQL